MIGAGGDRGRHAEDRGHADERHAERAGGGPRAAGDRPDDGADEGDGGVEDGRAEQRDAVGDDGRDRAGHVPRADQRADGEEDEDRPHRRGDAADGGVAERGRGVAVLERHQPGDHRARQQRHLQRPVRRVDPEQHDRERQQNDQHQHRDERVEEATAAVARTPVSPEVSSIVDGPAVPTSSEGRCRRR